MHTYRYVAERIHAAARKAIDAQKPPLRAGPKGTSWMYVRGLSEFTVPFLRRVRPSGFTGSTRNYRVNSLIRNRPTLVTYGRFISWALWWS